MIKSTRRNRRSAFTGFLCNNAMVGVQSSVLTNVSAGGSRCAHVLRMQPETLLLEDRVMPVVNLMVSDITITEGDAGTKNAVFTVTRDGNPSTAFKAAYTTQDGTGVSGAKAGVDYVESKGYLTFTPGQLKNTVSVPVIGNNRFEKEDRKFSLVVWDDNQPTGQNINFGDVDYWQNGNVNWTDLMAFGDLNGDGHDEIIVQQMWAKDGFTGGISDLRQISIYDTQSITPQVPIDILLLNNDLKTPDKVNSLQVVKLDASSKYADIVIGTSDSIVIFHGNQSLTQLASGKQDIPFAGGASKVIAGDFNNDGVAELVVVGAKNPLDANSPLPLDYGAYMLKAVNGVYGTPQKFDSNHVSDVIVNDFNHDTFKDVVLMKENWANNSNSSSYLSSFIDGSYIYNNTTGNLDYKSLAKLANGTIPASYPFTKFSTDPAAIGLPIDCSMTSQDFNGDKFDDIVINQTAATSQNSNLFILGGSATGELVSKGYLKTLSDSHGQIGSGDFNGDKIPDIAVSSPAGILFGTGKNDFSFTDRTQFQDLKANTDLTVTYSGGSSSLASNRLTVYDWNHDNIDDVLTNEKAMEYKWDNTNKIWTFKANPSAAGTTSIYYSSNTSTPTVPQFVNRETEGTGFLTNRSDTNNDKFFDLTSNTKDAITKLLGSQNPIYSKSNYKIIDKKAINASVGGVLPDFGNTFFADMNDDQNLDIISRIQLNADNFYAIYNYDLPSDTYKLSRQTKTAGPGSDIYIADFNGDKRNDVAYTTPGVSGVYFCFATGIAGYNDFTKEVLVPLDAGTMKQIFTVDVNNDSVEDVVYYGTKGLQVIFGGAQNSKSQLVPIASIPFNTPITIGNFHQDKTTEDKTTDFTQDLVGLFNGQVVTYPLNSDGSVGTAVPHPTRDGTKLLTATAVDFADFNNDGMDDFLVFDPNSSMKFLQGRFDGVYDVQASPRKGPTGVNDHFIRDLNGDKKLDLIYATNAPDDYMFIFNVSSEWEPESPKTASGEATIIDNDSAASIQIVQGDNQWAHLNNYYKDSLSVLVKNKDGTPVSGVTVSFRTVTGTLGSDAFFDSQDSVLSKSDGTVQASALKANNLPGKFDVIASVQDPLEAPLEAKFTESINIKLDYQYSSNSQTEGDFGSSNILSIIVTRTGDISYASSVDYTTKDGTALAGVDYDAVSGTILIPAGLSTGVIQVPIRGNTKLQSDRQFQVLLSNGFVDPTIPSVITLPGNIAVGTINDDDAPDKVFLDSGDQQISGIGLAFRKPLSVIVKNAAGNPVSGVPVTFKYVADVTLATATFANSVVQTSDANGLATSSTLTAGSIPGTFQVLATATGNGKIATNNFNETIIPLIQYSISDATITEGDNGTNSMEFTVSRNWSTKLNTPLDNIPYDSTVVYLTKDLTAIAGVDYLAVSDRIKFVANGLNTQKILIPILGNNKLQGNRIFQIQLTNPSVDPSVPTLAIAPAPANLANVTIVDDDAPDKVVIDNGDQQISGIGLAYRKPLSVIVKNAAGTPVSGVPVTFQFLADSTLATATFANSVVLTSDANGLATSSTLTAGAIPGTFQVLATATGNAKTATTSFNEKIIPLIQYSISDQTVKELDNGTKAMVFTVNRGWSTNLNTPSSVIPYASAVNYSTKDLTAIAGVDYIAAAGLIEFKTDELSQTFEIPIIGNNKLQGNRIFQIQLTNPSVDPSVPTLAIAPAPANLAKVTILDDDAPKEVVVNNGDAQSTAIGLSYTDPLSVIVKNAAGTPVSGVPVTYHVVLDASKATAGFAISNDQYSDANGRVVSTTLTAGPTPGTFKVSVSAYGYDSQTGTTLQAGTTFSETIVHPVQIDLSVSDISIVEGDTGTKDAVFTVTRSGNAELDNVTFRVSYTTQDGAGATGGKAGLDYVTTKGYLDFAAGELTKTVSVPVFGNNRFEPDRTFNLVLSDAKQVTGRNIQIGDVNYWQNTKINWTDQMAFGDLNGDGSDERIVQQLWAKDQDKNGITDLRQLSIYDTQSTTPEFPIDVMLLNNDLITPLKVNSLQVINLDKSVKDEGGVDFADIVIGTSDSVVIFHGKPSLTQLGTGKQVIPVTGGANKVIAQDFDNDGVAELVVVNNNGAYMLKAVNGVYSVTDTLYTGRVSDVIANDFNYDGWKDVVLMKETWAGTTYQSSFIDGSYINDKTGKLNFTSLASQGGTIPSSYQFTRISKDPVTNGALATIGLAIDCSMTSQDFNGDGFADLAINQTTATNQTSNLFILAGSATGGLQSKGYLSTLSDSRGQIGSGDFNGDGFQDIAVSSPAGILFGKGKNDFSFTDRTQFQDLKADTGLSVTYSGGSSSQASNRLAVYDWNKDGLPDVLTNEKAMNPAWDDVNKIWTWKANPSAAGATSIYYSSSTLTPTVPQFVKSETEGTGFWANVVDLNNDGVLDLTSNTKDTIYKLLGAPNPVYSKSGASTIPNATINTPVGGVMPDLGNTVFADMNNDLMLDIISRIQLGADNYYAIYNYDRPTDTYKLSRQTKTAGPGTDILVADFNGDKRNDIAYTTPGVSGVYFCSATRVDDFTRETLVPLSAGAMKQTFILDLNNNGKMDVVYYGNNGVQVVFDGEKGTVSPLVPVSFGSPIVVGDFGHDGTQDLVGLINNQVVTYPLKSDGSIGNVVTHATRDGSIVIGSAVDFGDFNNDGIDDFLVFNPTTSMKFLQGRLDGTYDIQASPRKGPSGVHDHFIRDLNGDGKLDLVYATNAPDDYMFIFNVSADWKPEFNILKSGEALIQDDDAPTSVQIVQGDNQFAHLNSYYKDSLSVLVKNINGTPVSGVSVSFQTKTGNLGSNASFDSLSSVKSKSDGTAQASGLKANNLPGIFQVIATAGSALNAPTVTFTETININIDYQYSSASIAEGDFGTSNLEFKVTRSGDINYASSVDYTTKDGTAIAGVDYDAVSGTIQFAAGENTKTILVPIRGNTKLQSDRQFQVLLSNGSVDPTIPAVITLPGNIAVGTINDDDAPKQLVIKDGNQQISGIGLAYRKPLSVTVKNAAGNPVSGVPVTFQYVADTTLATATFANSVVLTSDANGLATSSTLTAGPIPGTFQVLASATGNGKTATVNFNETIIPLIQYSISDATVAEGDNGSKMMVFTVNRGWSTTLNTPSPVIPYASAVNYLSKNLTAIAGVDYEAVSGSLQFAAGESTKTFEIPIIGNNKLQVDRKFQIQLTSPTVGPSVPTLAIAPAPANLATVTILDDDAPNQVVIDGGDQQISGIGLAYRKPLSVIVKNAAGTPVSGVPVTFKFVADTTLATATFANSVIQTSDVNGLATSSTLTAGPIPGTFQVLASATGNGKTATVNFNETIIPLIQYSISDATVAEGDNGSKMMVFTVNRGWSTTLNTPSPVIPYASAVNYLSKNLTAIAGVDYEAVSGSLQFAAGESTKTFEIPIIGNNKLQVDRKFQIQLTSPTVDPSVPTVAIAPTNPATVTILDDDAPKQVLVDSGDQQISGIGLAFRNPASSVVLNAAGTPVSGVSVTFRIVTDATKATASFANSTTLISDSNGRVTSSTFTAGPIPGTFQIDATASGNGQTANVRFNETIIPLIQYSISDSTVQEGDYGSKVMEFTVSRVWSTLVNTPSTSIPYASSVDYSTKDGTGLSGVDYQGVTGTLQFQAGEMTKIVQIQINGNTRLQADRLFQFQLSKPTIDPSAPTLISAPVSTVNCLIKDDDAPKSFTVESGNDQTVGIGQDYPKPVSVIVLNQAGNPVSGSSVSFKVVDGPTTATAKFANSNTLIADSNGRAISSQLTAGQTPGQFQVVATASGNGQSATVNINETIIPLIKYLISDATVQEGDTGTKLMVYTVTRGGSTNLSTSIDFATSDGTGLAGADYVNTSGTLTFAANESVKKISIPVISNTIFQSDRSFNLTLSNPAWIPGQPIVFQTPSPVATGKIMDDDNPQFISIVSGDQQSVILGTDYPNALSVKVQNLNGSVVSGVPINFEVRPGLGNVTASFANPATVISDSNGLAVASKLTAGLTPGSFMVYATANGYLSSKTAVFQLTQRGTITYSMADSSVKEGTSGLTPMVFTVTRTGTTWLDSSIDFKTINGTALAGVDYEGNSGRIYFAPNELSKTIKVNVIGNTTPQADRKFSVAISLPSGTNPQPIDLIFPAAASQGTILDDDVSTGITPRSIPTPTPTPSPTPTPTPAPQPVLQSYAIQKGATGRSFVRYVDLVLNDLSTAANVVSSIASSAPRIRLTNKGLSGTSNSPVSLQGFAKSNGTSVNIDFGTKGLGGSPTTSTADGSYLLEMDLDANGSYETSMRFHRLLGDVNGDKVVDGKDTSLANSSLNKSGLNLPADTTGDGKVNATDVAYIKKAQKRKILI